MVWEDRNSLAELKKSGDSIDRPAGDAERRNKDKQPCFCITENKQKNTPTHSTGRFFLLTSFKKKWQQNVHSDLRGDGKTVE